MFTPTTSHVPREGGNFYLTKCPKRESVRQRLYNGIREYRCTQKARELFSTMYPREQCNIERSLSRKGRVFETTDKKTKVFIEYGYGPYGQPFPKYSAELDTTEADPERLQDLAEFANSGCLCTDGVQVYLRNRYKS